VLEFASEFLSEKLEKEGNRRIVERTLSTVLGKRCRVRGAVRGDSPEDAGAVAQEPPARPATRTAQANPTASSDDADPFQAAESDPLVQDLLSRGGKVTDVRQLSDE
jgi:hypothetical protein